MRSHHQSFSLGPIPEYTVVKNRHIEKAGRSRRQPSAEGDVRASCRKSSSRRSKHTSLRNGNTTNHSNNIEGNRCNSKF
jgi:hypothetical protein